MFLRDKNQSANALLSILNTIAGSVRMGAGYIMPRGTRRHISRTKYSGEQLREIRARKGVGRPIAALSFDKIQELLWRGAKCCRAQAHASVGMPSPNYAEWLRKPRRKVRGPAA